MRLQTQHCLWLELGQELPGKSQEQGKGVRAQPGFMGAAGWGERSMQGQGHAWAQLNSRPSHVGESVALAERLVLFGVECLPFQVGLADLGRRAPTVRAPGPSPHPRAQRWYGRDTREWKTQSRVPSYHHRAKMGTPHGSRAPRCWCTPHRARLPGGATAPTSSRGGRHRAHRTDEASVVPAEPQRLQEPVPSINLEIAATALGAKHLLVVCKERQSPGQRSPAPQPLVPGDLGAGLQPSPDPTGTAWGQLTASRGEGSCRRHPGEMPVLCRAATGRRQTSSPRMQHSALMYIRHRYGNMGAMALLGHRG